MKLIILFILATQMLIAEGDLAKELELIYAKKMQYEKQQELNKKQDLNNINTLREENNKQQVKTNLAKNKNNQYDASLAGKKEQISYLLSAYNNKKKSILLNDYVKVNDFIKINNKYMVKVNKNNLDNIIDTLVENSKEYVDIKSRIAKLKAMKKLKNIKFLKEELKELSSKLNSNNKSTIASYSSSRDVDLEEVTTIVFDNTSTVNYNNILKITFLNHKIKVEIK